MKRIKKNNVIFIVLAGLLALSSCFAFGIFGGAGENRNAVSAYGKLPGYGSALYPANMNVIDFTEFENTYIIDPSTGAIGGIPSPFTKTILINTADDLYVLSYRVNGRPKAGDFNTAITATRNFYRAANYKLANNIEYGAMASSKGLLTMGTAEYPFAGVFDGQGFEIRNLFFETGATYISAGDSLAPFGYNNGTVINLGVTYGAVDITGMSTAVSSKAFAGIVSNNMAGGTVKFCFAVAGPVTANNVYGIAAVNNGTIDNTYFATTGAITSAGNKLPIAGSGVTNSFYVSAQFPGAAVQAGVTGLTDANLKSGSGMTGADADGPRWYANGIAALAGGYPRLAGAGSGNTLMRPADIITLPEMMNGNSAYGGYSYKITKDIDFTAVSESAYVMPAALFTGTIDGAGSTGAEKNNNYALINLRITTNVYSGTNENHCGMFRTGTATFRNINFVGGYVRPQELTKNNDLLPRVLYIGMCASKQDSGTLTFNNVHSSADISFAGGAVGNSMHMGGLLGHSQSAVTVTDCSVSGAVDGGTHSTYTNVAESYQNTVGGICGYMYNAANRITNTTFYGTVTGVKYTRREITTGASSATPAINVGGIAGTFYTNTANAVSGATLAAGAEVYSMPADAPDLASPSEFTSATVRAGGLFGYHYTSLSTAFATEGVASYGTLYIVEYGGLYNGVQLSRTINAGGLMGYNYYTPSTGNSGGPKYTGINQNGTVVILNPGKKNANSTLNIGGFVGSGYFNAENCAPANDLKIDSYSTNNIFVAGIAYEGIFNNCNVTTDIYLNTGTDTLDNFSGRTIYVGGYNSYNSYSYTLFAATSCTNTGNIYIGKAGAAGFYGGTLYASTMFNGTYNASYCENKGKIIFNTNYITPAASGYSIYLAGVAYYAYNMSYCKNDEGGFILKNVGPVSGTYYPSLYLNGLAQTAANISDCVNNTDLSIPAASEITANLHISGLAHAGTGTMSNCTFGGKIDINGAVRSGNMYIGGLAYSRTTMTNSVNNAKININAPFTGASIYLAGLASYTCGTMTGSQNNGDINLNAACSGNYLYVAGLCSGTITTLNSGVNNADINIGATFTGTYYMYLSGLAYTITTASGAVFSKSINLNAAASCSAVYLSGLAYSGTTWTGCDYAGIINVNAPFSVNAAASTLYLAGFGETIATMTDCVNRGTANITVRFSTAGARTFNYSGIVRTGVTLTGCVNEGALVMPDNVFNGGTNTKTMNIAGIAYTVTAMSQCVNTRSFTISESSGAAINCGGLVYTMTNSASAVISDSANTGNITLAGSFTTVRAAGICAYNNRVRITNCFNSGNISLGTSTVNAVSTGLTYLAGINNDPVTGSVVDNCYNSGNISEYNATVTNNIGHYVGGICGYLNATTVNFENCVNSGAVSTNNPTTQSNYFSSAGGIIGCDFSAAAGVLNIINCLNYGAVQGGTAAGGIMAYGYRGIVNIKNAVNHGAVNATTYAGGIVGECQTSITATSTLSYAVNYGKVTGPDAGSGGIFGNSNTTAFTGAGNVNNILYVWQTGSSLRMAGTSSVTPDKTTTAMTVTNTTTNNTGFAGIVIASNGSAAGGIYHPDFFLRKDSSFTQELVYNPYANVGGSWHGGAAPYVSEVIDGQTVNHIYAVCNSLGRDYALYLTDNLNVSLVYPSRRPALASLGAIQNYVFNYRQVLYPTECEIAEAPLVLSKDGGELTRINVNAVITSEETPGTEGFVEFYINSEVIPDDGYYDFIFNPAPYDANSNPYPVILSKGANIAWEDPAGSGNYGSVVHIIFDYTVQNGGIPVLEPDQSYFTNSQTFTVYRLDEGGNTIAQKTWTITIYFTPTNKSITLTDIYINAAATAASPTALVYLTDYTKDTLNNTTTYTVNSYFDDALLEERNMLLNSTAARLRIDFNTMSCLEDEDFASMTKLYRLDNNGLTWSAITQSTAGFTFTANTGSLLRNGYVRETVNTEGVITGKLSICISLGTISATAPSGTYKLEIIYQDTSGDDVTVNVIIERGKNTSKSITNLIFRLNNETNTGTIAVSSNLNPSVAISYGLYPDFTRFVGAQTMSDVCVSIALPAASYLTTTSRPLAVSVTQSAYAHIYTVTFRGYSEFDAGYAILKDRAGYYNEYNISFIEDQPTTSVYTFAFNNVLQSNFYQTFQVDRRALLGAGTTVYTANTDYGLYSYGGSNIWYNYTANQQKSVLHRIDYEVELTRGLETTVVGYNPYASAGAAGSNPELVNIFAKNNGTTYRIEQSIAFGADTLSGTYKITQLARAIEAFNILPSSANSSFGYDIIINGAVKAGGDVSDGSFMLDWPEYRFQPLTFEKVGYRECYATSLNFGINPNSLSFISSDGSPSDARREDNNNITYLTTEPNIIGGVDTGSRAGNASNVFNNPNRIKQFTLTAGYTYDDLSYANRVSLGIPLYAALWMRSLATGQWILLYDADPDTGEPIAVNPVPVLPEMTTAEFRVTAESGEYTTYIVILSGNVPNKAIEVKLNVPAGYTGFLFVTLYTVLAVNNEVTGLTEYRVTRQTNIIWGTADSRDGDGYYTYDLVAHISAYYSIDVHCLPGYGITKVTSNYLGSGVAELEAMGRPYINLNFGGEDSDLVTITIGSAGEVPWGLHSETGV